MVLSAISLEVLKRHRGFGPAGQESGLPVANCELAGIFVTVAISYCLSIVGIFTG